MQAAAGRGPRRRSAMAERLEAVAKDVAVLRQAVARQRREINDGTKRQHFAAVRTLSGRCRCCGSCDVLVEGRKAESSRSDHFYTARKPDVEHTRLICQPRHADLTKGGSLGISGRQSSGVPGEAAANDEPS